MIDWMSMSVPLRHPSFIQGGKLIKLNKDETAIEWDSAAWDSIEGSHESSIRIRSTSPELRSLDIQGNPVKWFQGHNVFGTDDLAGLVVATYRAVAKRLGITPDARDLADVLAGNCTLTRVDLNNGYRLESRGAVMASIRALDNAARLTHRGRGTLKGDSTIYFGESSTYWSMKFYSKGAEIEAKGHRLPEALRVGPLEQYADCLLRQEVTLRSRELHRCGLDRVDAWGHNQARKSFLHYQEKIVLSEEVDLSPATLEALPPKLQGVYALWKNGTDLRTIYTRRTFYRYRAEMLKFGLDIAIVQLRDPALHRPQLRLVLNACEASIPEWARGTPLFFEPSEQIAA
jgi:II/X family phage/plasmid replication protein